jgi:hypothetical protein
VFSPPMEDRFALARVEAPGWWRKCASACTRRRSGQMELATAAPDTRSAALASSSSSSSSSTASDESDSVSRFSLLSASNRLSTRTSSSEGEEESVEDGTLSAAGEPPAKSASANERAFRAASFPAPFPHFVNRRVERHFRTQDDADAMEHYYAGTLCALLLAIMALLRTVLRWDLVPDWNLVDVIMVAVQIATWFYLVLLTRAFSKKEDPSERSTISWLSYLLPARASSAIDPPMLVRAMTYWLWLSSVIVNVRRVTEELAFRECEQTEEGNAWVFCFVSIIPSFPLLLTLGLP